jgi:hypothetical protein
MIFFAGKILKQMKKFLEKKGSVISCVGNKKGNEIANFWRRMVVLMVNILKNLYLKDFVYIKLKYQSAVFIKKYDFYKSRK